MHGAITGLAKRLIEWTAKQTVPVLSLDIPSGVYHRLGIPYTTPFVNNPIVRLFTDSLINTEE
ncbi:MAG: hypothetical protein KFF77_06270 [Bacteroidetes bacterium]|nr:hypothetical protein [Bacteroidota bacterium]